MATTKRVVYAALIANFLIAITKFGAWTLTGSSSMLSETYHSISDTGNQVLLLLGIRLSERGDSREFPFGRGKEQYFFAFVVSVLLFGVAGYASFTEGINRLDETYHHRDVLINYVVLTLALVFESYALWKAYKGIRREMEEKEFKSIVQAYRNTKDATLITALTEDTVAVLGIIVAAGGIYFTEVTHNTLYDAGASMLIGILLMGFSVMLAWENRGLIVGEGVSRNERKELIDAIKGGKNVIEIVDLRTLHLGAENVLVAAEVEFEDNLETDEIEASIDDIESRIRETLPAAKKIFIEAEDAEATEGKSLD